MIDAVYYVFKIEIDEKGRKIALVDMTNDPLKALMTFIFLSLANEVAAILKIGTTDEEAREVQEELLYMLRENKVG